MAKGRHFVPLNCILFLVLTIFNLPFRRLDENGGIEYGLQFRKK
jgi:hypothetical protein